MLKNVGCSVKKWKLAINVMIDSSQSSWMHFREYFFHARLRHQKEKAVSLILLPEILSRALPLTWLPIARHTLWAWPSKVLTIQRMHQARDQRTLLVYTWLLGWLCVVPLLELALMSSEEPATGTGQPVTGDTRNWLGCHERSVKPRSQLPSERQWLLCLAGKLRKKEF